MPMTYRAGPATQRNLREFHDYADQRYQRPAQISVAHLYRLRRSPAYRRQRMDYQRTRPSAVSIGAADTIPYSG